MLQGGGAAAGVAAGVAAGPPHPTTLGGFGAALVFVMLAYGGFNDAATLSAEVRRPRDMTIAMVGGMGLVTALYLLTNWAYLKGLGVAGLAASDAPAATLMRVVFGRVGETAMVALVGVTSLSSLNALVIVGGRTLYAVSSAEPGLARLAAWDTRRGVPRLALWTQSAVAIALVAWGAWTRRGFAAMVDYMAPVYWLFLGLAGVALLVLRRTHSTVARPYRTPFAPLVAGGFAVGAACVLVASLRYVGWAGGFLSFGVLLVGLILRKVLSRSR